MGVHATQPTKAIDCDPNAFEVGKLDAAIVAHHHVFNVAAAIDERADLPACFVRQFGELTRKLRRQNLVRCNSPRVKLFYSAKLIRLEARGVSDYVLDSSGPPSTQVLKLEQKINSRSVGRHFGFGLKLQDE
jgi:hypothetical protein